ncbi:hypothetical protein RI844_00050 [Thalassotalea fonticola]|uniref:Uncharacterized protein n=1 Tax=Thalassotalea fonticola TaxID=3065649 RepID=A0ABZ0GPS7_9GAMM|nr:hypothetical protein RI844_20240 [Colwelliaceae bacterium S1-1]WOH37670.1 hypothetical protein RI844_00050 [Colwelliaceae bacterium S1-1]
MEFSEISKIVFGIVTAVGTIALTFFNMSQTRKVTAELLEKFEIAVEKTQKNSVTELFRLIHGLRMNYQDIIELINHDDCSRIIYALKRTPGLVCYENGSFQYTSIGRNSIFKFVDKWFTRLGIATFSIFTFASYLLLVFGNNYSAIAGFFMLIVFAFMLGRQLRQRRYDQMVESLVKPELMK